MNFNYIKNADKNNKLFQIDSAKYIPAQKSKSFPNKCFLFLCEGDSAQNFVVSMLNGKNDFYGILTL